MKDDLDALHHVVTAATGVALDTFAALDEARTLEQHAATRRAEAEQAHAAAVAKLTEARAALDARLGIRLVSQPPPVRTTVGAGVLTASKTPAPPVPEWEDDDDPVRG